MGSTKVLITGGIIAAVAATALLVPTLAFGQPLGAALPGGSSVIAAQDDDAPGSGQGKAWGHHKDSPDFPGQGKGLDKGSPDFPGQGKGLDKNKGDSLDDGSVDPEPEHGNGKGKALGHDKPGNPHNDDD
jgi:hypothetical protein